MNERSIIEIFKSAAGFVLCIAPLSLTLHYFYSLRFWIKELDEYSLSTFSVLSLDDILFPAAKFNIPLFAVILLLFSTIAMILHLSIPRLQKVSAIKKEYIMLIIILIYIFVIDIAYKHFLESKVDLKATTTMSIILDDGREIRTGSDCHLVLYGTKYIILSDNENKAHLISTSFVREVIQR